FATISSKLFSPPTRVRWKRAWREYEKCSHSVFATSTPCFFSSASTIDLASGPQPPQLVAHFVFFLSAPSVVQPALTASQIWPLDTLLQEQISAVAGSRSTPMPLAAPSRAGRMRSSGWSGSGIAFNVICSRLPYSAASPTSTAPSRYLPSPDTTSFL